MPVVVRKHGSKFRVVEAATKQVATTPQGHARDGGGHSTEAQALAQARAINSAIGRPAFKPSHR